MSSDSVLEVQAIYRGVVIDTRYLDAAAKRACGSAYVIGATPNAQAPVDVDYTAGADFTLVERAGDDFLVNVAPRMTGEVQGEAAAIPLDRWIADRGSPFAIPGTGRARIVCGDTTYVLSTTTRAPLVPRPMLSLKWREQKYTVASGVGLLFFVLLLSLVPPEVKALSFDRYDARLRFTTFLITPSETKIEPVVGADDKSEAAKSASGKAHAGPDGKMGSRTSRETNHRFAIQGPADNPDPHLAQRQADQIKKSGVLGVLSGLQGSPLASVFGRDTALGRDDATVLGNLVAPTTGAAFGVDGLGMVGTGAGAAGTGEGTIGLGTLGTIGSLGDGGRDPGYGRGGPARLTGRRAIAPEFVVGQPTVRGALDKEIIRRIIRRHINEVKYCYEKELVHDQALTGRVAVTFTIAPSGLVAAAVVQSSTLNNARVASCVVDAVRRWEFPKPEGGGLVIATYPFTFIAAGER